MQSTLTLLDRALKLQPAAEWHRKLKLSKNALHSAKTRGNLSPAIAYALAEEMGENAPGWALVAAMESERDSACKERMVKRLGTKVLTFMQP